MVPLQIYQNGYIKKDDKSGIYKDIGQWQHSYWACENVNWCNHFGRLFVII